MLGALLLAMATGCPFSFTNDDHCAAQQGDATCAAANAATPYCALDGCGLYDEVDNVSGCVAELPTDLSCYSPCGGKQDANARGECSGATDTDSSASSTAPETEGSVTGALTSDPTISETDGCDCGPDAPICDAGVCVPCAEDQACVDAGLPGICASDGRCVECISTLPQVGAAAHLGCTPGVSGLPNCIDDRCEGACQFPEDCPGTGCDLEAGLCAPLDAVFHVSPDGSDASEGDGAGDGTREAPLRTIGEALDRLRDEDPAGFGTISLRSNASYAEDVLLVGERVVLRSWVSDSPRNGSTTAPVVTGAEGTTLDPEAPSGVVTLTRGGGRSLLIVSGVDFDLGGGELPFAHIESTCLLVVDNAEILNSPGVVRGDSLSVAFRNSLIAGSTQVPFRAEETSDVVITASTVVNNGTEAWFECPLEALPDTGFRLVIAESIVGYDDSPANLDGLIPDCAVVSVVERNSRFGTEVGSGDFREPGDNDFRLNAPANPQYFFQGRDSVSCPDGELKQTDYVAPCPPNLDAEGNTRTGMPGWAGYDASSPPPPMDE